MQKRWITAGDERVCPTCAPLHEQEIPLKDRFHSNGEKFYSPQPHPNCRCRLELVYPKDYLNHVEEIIRKRRVVLSKAEHYNRDTRGRFAHLDTLQDRPYGWTAALATQDQEKHSTAPKRMRLREYDPAEAQRLIETAFQEPEPEAPSPFAWKGYRAESVASPFAGKSPFAAKPITQTPPRPKQGTHTITYIHLNNGTQVPIQIPEQPHIPGEKVQGAVPLGTALFGHNELIGHGIEEVEIQRANGERVTSITDYEASLGDTINFPVLFGPDGTPYSRTGLASNYDVYANEVIREEADWAIERFSMQRQDVERNFRDSFRGANYGIDEDSFDEDAQWAADDLLGNPAVVVTVYQFDEIHGFRSDQDEDMYLPAGKYVVSDVDETDEVGLHERQLGIDTVRTVYLSYLEDEGTDHGA
jgi:hypothetical protein